LKERRKYTRKALNSLVRGWILRKFREVKATTVNICQGSAFFMSPGLVGCQKGDDAMLEMVLLPTTTGQKVELSRPGCR
jgi:hypothetical protein